MPHIIVVDLMTSLETKQTRQHFKNLALDQPKLRTTIRSLNKVSKCSHIDNQCRNICYGIKLHMLHMMVMYVIYEPRLQGVFNKYTTRVLGHRKFTTDKPRARIHMIYTMMKTLTNKITMEISTFHSKVMFPVTKCSHELERHI